MISFTVMGVPIAKGRPKFARRGKYVTTYTPDKTRNAEETFVARSLEFRPVAPYGCPIRLMAVFELPIPASWPAWKRALALTGNYMHVAKPDVDNLVKLVKDALKGVFWIDDSQIICVKAVKHYSPIPKTRIEIEPIEQGEKPAARKRGTS